MREAVQHVSAPAKLLYCQAVIFLVKEKACFLPVLYVYNIFYAVFHNFHFCVKRFAEKAFFRLHALLSAYLRVTALIYAPNLDAVLRQRFQQKAQYGFLHAVNAQRKRLYDKHVRKLIDHKAGQEIRLTKNQAAGRSIHNLFTVFPCRPHAFAQERFVNQCFPAAAHNAYGNFRTAVIKACPHGVTIEVLYNNQSAVLRLW